MGDYPDFGLAKDVLQAARIGKNAQFNNYLDRPVDSGEKFYIAYSEEKGVIWGFAAEITQSSATDTGQQQKFHIKIDDQVFFVNEPLSPHLVNRRMGITSPVVGMPFSTVYDDTNGRWTIAWIFPHPIRFEENLAIIYENAGSAKTYLTYLVMWWKEE